MKRLVLCFALAIILALGVQTESHSNAQWTLESVDLTLADTNWVGLGFSFDENGRYTGWSLDKFTSLSKGVGGSTFTPKSLGPLQTGTYTESYHGFLSDTYNIWRNTMWLDFGGQLYYMGIGSSKNPTFMGVKLEGSQNPAYGLEHTQNRENSIFFGMQIPFSLTSTP